MRLNRNICWKLIAVTIWNVPEHCNDVIQCFGLFQFVDTNVNSHFIHIDKNVLHNVKTSLYFA